MTLKIINEKWNILFVSLSREISLLILFLGIVYIWSPLSNNFDLFFFQTEKIYMTIYWLCGYFLLASIQQIWRHENVLSACTMGDIVFIIYAIYLTTLVLRDWEVINQEFMLYNIASIALYIAIRGTGEKLCYPILWSIPILLVWQLYYSISKSKYIILDHISGSFFNVGIWGCFLSCMAMGALGYIYICKSKWVKIIFILTFILSLWCVFLSCSRAAWTSIAAGCGYMFWKQKQNITLKLRWTIIIMFVALLATAVISTKEKKGSIQGRWLIWTIGKNIYMDFPHGIGIDGFSRNYMAYQEKYLQEQGNDEKGLLADENYYAFNEILKVLIEQGWLGGLFIISLSLSNLIIPTKKNNLYICIKSMLITWIFFSLFSYPMTNFQTRTIFIVLLALLSSFQHPIKIIRWNSIIQFTGGILIVSILHITIPYHLACSSWFKWIVKGEATTLTKLKPLMNSPAFLPNYAMLLNREGRFQEAEIIARHGVILYNSYFSALELGKSLKSQGKYQEADQSWQKAGYILPNRFTPLFLQMEMWQELDEREKAKKSAHKILSKKIKIRSPRLTYIRLKAQETLLK